MCVCVFFNDSSSSWRINWDVKPHFLISYCCCCCCYCCCCVWSRSCSCCSNINQKDWNVFNGYWGSFGFSLGTFFIFWGLFFQDFSVSHLSFFLSFFFFLAFTVLFHLQVSTNFRGEDDGCRWDLISVMDASQILWWWFPRSCGGSWSLLKPVDLSGSPQDYPALWGVAIAGFYGRNIKKESFDRIMLLEQLLLASPPPPPFRSPISIQTIDVVSSGLFGISWDLVRFIAVLWILEHCILFLGGYFG